MRRAPVVTLVAITSLGFAIGAVTTAYSWMDRFVVHTLPGVPHPERLVSASMAFPSGSTGSISMPALREWRDGSRTVNLAGHSAALVGLRTGEGSLPVWAMCNSSSLFDVLEVRPLLGRWMTREEEDAEARVAVLGHAFWSRQFLGDSSVVGRSITLNGIPVTVIGVAPRGFAGPWVGLHFDVYVPVTIRYQLLDTPNQAENRGSQQYLAVIGRLRPGVSLAQARQDLRTLAERTAEAVGWEYSASVQRLSDVDPAASLKAVFAALLAVTVLILLVACANVASVFLARAAARQQEIAMRLALGARRSRLVRQMLTEGLALSLLAGCLGLLLSVWSRGLIAAFVPRNSMPVDLAMTLNLRVVGCALLVAVLTALLFGLLPALRVSSPSLVGALKEVTGTALGHRARLQSGLVVAQVAFALVALVCAGLFVRSLSSSRRLDVGFRRPEGVLLVDTDLRHAGLRDTMGLPVAQRLLEEVRGVAGVRSAAFSTDVPLGFGGGSQNSVRVEGYVPRRNEGMEPRYSMVSGDYFRTMEIPIMLGRQIGEEDRRGGQRVAVVNEEFARRWLGGRNPLGARVAWSGDTTWMTVVGVARNGKYERLSESPRPVIWVPLWQRFPRSFTVHARTEGEPQLLAGALRRAFAAAHPDLPFLDVRTMAQHMEASLFTSRMGAYMLSGFGAVALLLSSVGLYGLMAYTVSRRTREIGVRMALGAGRAQVVTMVVRAAMRMVGIGLLVGALAALGAGRLLRSQLLGVSPYDPATLLAVAALLAGVALAATLLPARRAARVDPIVALRHE